MKDPAFPEDLERLSPELQIVVAFRMMPERVESAQNKHSICMHPFLNTEVRLRLIKDHQR